jgi:hypothetical protein
MPSEGEPPEQTPLRDLVAAINASAVIAAEETPDSKTQLETADIQIQFDRERIRSLGQDIDERKKYAHRIFCLISAWLAVCFLLLILDGVGHGKWFSLPEGVLLAVIGGTTADVLGIFYIVTHYLFPQNIPQPILEEAKQSEPAPKGSGILTESE